MLVKLQHQKQASSEINRIVDQLLCIGWHRWWQLCYECGSDDIPGHPLSQVFHDPTNISMSPGREIAATPNIHLRKAAFFLVVCEVCIELTQDIVGL
jgi:hypothetical protein